MQKNQAYHEAAIAYNEGLADAAETLAETLGHEEPQRWCRAVAKQHRFHAKRHRSALEKLLASESLNEDEVDVEQIPDGLDLPETVVETGEVTDGQDSPQTVVETPEAEQAEEEPAAEEIIEEAPGEDYVHDDGCVGYHNPMDPNCAYFPQTGGQQ